MSERRDLILHVAHRLFRHYGPQKTTMADVAREVGVGVGTVYLDFPSKDAILEELSNREHAAAIESMRRAAGDSADPAALRLVRVFEARAVAFLALVDGTGAHACDLLHCGNEAVRAAQKRYSEAERQLVSSILEDGKKTGELDFEDLAKTLGAVLGAYASWVPPLLWKTTLERLGGEISAMHELVLHGLLARDGRRSPTNAAGKGSPP